MSGLYWQRYEAAYFQSVDAIKKGIVAGYIGVTAVVGGILAAPAAASAAGYVGLNAANYYLIVLPAAATASALAMDAVGNWSPGLDRYPTMNTKYGAPMWSVYNGVAIGVEFAVAMHSYASTRVRGCAMPTDMSMVSDATATVTYVKPEFVIPSLTSTSTIEPDYSQLDWSLE